MEASEANRVSARALLGLAWPIVLARATQAVVGFSDALMVAPLGEASLAAVTTAALDFFTVVMLPMGTVFILQSFAAQLRGRGEEHSARRYAYYGVAFSLVSGLVGLAVLPWLRLGIEKLNYSPEVATPMVSYMGIRMLSLAPSVGSEAFGNYYGGLGRTRPAMLAGLITMLANITLNFLWISPRFGLPGYGFEGAAWASTAASFAGFLCSLGLLFSENKLPLGQEFSLLRLSEVRSILRFGLPSGFNYFLEFLAFTLFINVVVGHLGKIVLAAFNVVLQINSLSFMPAFGVASAAAILVGESIGEGKKDRVPLLVRKTLFLTTAWMGTVGAVYLLFPSFLAFSRQKVRPTIPAPCSR